MIKPIGAHNISSRADKHTIDRKTGEYKDPLMNWPLRGAAFTNEVGEALRPIIGNAANLTWIPALMYIGADVYDKYKNGTKGPDCLLKLGLSMEQLGKKDEACLAFVNLPTEFPNAGKSILNKAANEAKKLGCQ